jgi:hypothetical protein
VTVWVRAAAGARCWPPRRQRGCNTPPSCAGPRCMLRRVLPSDREDGRAALRSFWAACMRGCHVKLCASC